MSHRVSLSDSFATVASLSSAFFQCGVNLAKLTHSTRKQAISIAIKVSRMMTNMMVIVRVGEHLVLRTPDTEAGRFVLAPPLWLLNGLGVENRQAR